MSYSTEVIVDSPTAYWPLNETNGTTITDSVGGVVLTAAGTPTFNIRNYINTGIDFGGSSNFNNATPGAAFKWTLNTDFTIEFCLRRSSVDAATRALVACRTDGATNRQFGVFLLSGTNLLFDVGGSGNRWTTGLNINDTLWHHIVLKHRGSDGHREFWQDGAVRATTTQKPTTADATAGSMYVGSAGGSSSVLGALSDVAIYNGTYLSDARCVAHWLQIQNRNSSFMAEVL